MIDTLLSKVAPHLCCGCGKIGSLLCDNCKYDINNDVFRQCLACRGPAGETGVCHHCKLPYERAWCVGERSGVLQRLVGDFKFQNMYAGYIPLAGLLHERIDILPSNTVVVPVPTVPSHIRERGYDHTLLLARRLAKSRGLRTQALLRRATSTKQRDASRQQRIEQAKVAFALNGAIDADTPYLIIDDIVTTGATVYYAADILRAAGAKRVWVAAIARQTLD
jgi:ComF family protein